MLSQAGCLIGYGRRCGVDAEVQIAGCNARTRG